MKNLEHNTLSMFHTPREKGHSEWDAFSTVRGDSAGAYRVALPRKPLVVRSSDHLLRIIYPQSHSWRPAR